MHYYSKRFYAPVLLSIDNTEGEFANKYFLRFNVSSERTNDFNGKVRIAVKNNKFDVIYEKVVEVNVSALSSKYIYEEDFSQYVKGFDRERFISFELLEGNDVLSCSSHIFVLPKKYNFVGNVEFSIKNIKGERFVVLKADGYANNVGIDSAVCDFRLEDNYIDIISKDEVLIKIESDCTDEELEKNLQVNSLKNVK